MIVRPTERADLPALQRVLETIELFPADMLPALIASYLGGEGDDVWLTALAEGEPVGLLYAERERASDRAWNMRAIGVSADAHRTGTGRALVARLEADLRAAGQRLLVVDTSSTDGYAAARAFYRSLDYEEEGRVRDFWTDGDDKVVFRKRL